MSEALKINKGLTSLEYAATHPQILLSVAMDTFSCLLAIDAFV